MSKLNKILGVFIFLLVVSSCSKDDDKDEKEFEINGTYKVSKVSKGDADVASVSGNFDVKKQSGDKVQLVSQKFTVGTWIKDAGPLVLLSDITKIDSKAYEIKVGDVGVATNSAYKIPFKHSVKLDDFSDDPAKVAVIKAALGGVDKVDFKDDAKMMDIGLTFKPATTQKITYGGKQYIGVIQKNQIELALNVDAVATVALDVAGLIASIQNPTGAGAVDVKAKVALILNLADDNANKKAFNDAIKAVIAKFKPNPLDAGYGESQYNADYVFTLKKQ